MNKYLHDKQPEIELLKLSALGIDTNLSPSPKDYQNIARELSSKKMVILFRWFLRHSEVSAFANEFIPTINPEDIAVYLKKLSKVMSHRTSIHWIERINLFHIYGLARLFDSKTGLKILESDFGHSITDKKVVSLSDISAHNVLLMLKEAIPSESLQLLERISDPALIALYGQYQIYYYGGFHDLLKKLKSYKGTYKEVIIPQTIAGLFLTEPSSLLLSKSIKEEIYDDIISTMPMAVVNKLDA